MTGPRRAIGVVDDDSAVLKAIGRLLRVCGYEVHVFSSAQQFLAELPKLEGQVGCLVVDVHMPGRSGLELKADLDLAGSTIPIVLVTGAADAKLRSRALAEGAIALLQKPFTETELLRAIAQGLERGREGHATPPTGIRT